MTKRKDVKWEDAIAKVLDEEREALHTTAIAEAIEARGYRTSLGATPAQTVASVLSTSLKSQDTKFIRVARGQYYLRNPSPEHSVMGSNIADEDAAEEATGAIQCFGAFWSRSAVRWKTQPKLLGQSSEKSDPVDFAAQNGVYLLHDRHRTIYVGRASSSSLGLRLNSHTRGRLSSRWDRFSWFGLRAVTDSGELEDISHRWDEDAVSAALEAILIESIEPPQNRRGGDGFAASEFYQIPDPEIEKQNKDALLRELLAR